jgi:molecular chaperone DnaK
MGGVMTPVIERNTTIPARKSQVFSTAEDGQTAVDIHVMQGERPMVEDNMDLGRFRLEGIPASQRGLPQIEVTFDIDANGILNVSARDQASGREQKVTITASTNLNKADIERMVQEANKNKNEDQKRRELAEVRNLADNVIYQVEKALKDQGGAVSAGSRSKIEGKITELRQAMTGNDTGPIQRLSEELQQVASQGVQETAKDSGEPNGHGKEGRSEGDVVEGEFHDA